MSMCGGKSFRQLSCSCGRRSPAMCTVEYRRMMYDGQSFLSRAPRENQRVRFTPCRLQDPVRNRTSCAHQKDSVHIKWFIPCTSRDSVNKKKCRVSLARSTRITFGAQGLELIFSEILLKTTCRADVHRSLSPCCCLYSPLRSLRWAGAAESCW